MFPHHENELAQTSAAQGVGSCCGGSHDSTFNQMGSPGSREDRGFVRFWMHNGFVNVDSEKMSKSLGNFFTIREVSALRVSSGHSPL